MKIIKLADELAEYEIENLNRNRPLDISVDALIYCYHTDGYSGHGVAIYLDNKDGWHLDEISHCSCNGALDEGFNKISYTRPQIVQILKKRASEDWKKDDYNAVLKALEEQL